MRAFFHSAPIYICQLLHVSINSSYACQISECLQEDEIAVLSVDLATLADMLAGILARKAA